MEDLIRQLATRVVSRLNNLEAEVDFEYLLNLPDPDLRSEAVDLYEGICKLKEKLQGLG
ncbi:hypothetical protein ASZ90_018907 [hydrocarbon metagenome]|uniref:Uncharacterized protein n=1 Tax=hydrocarbon metagenome TaxID=938273 RepID=A0A0W8E4S9_9ZZZZ